MQPTPSAATVAPPDAGRAAPVVSARGVTKGYASVPVLTNLDFDVFRGITGLLGANGAGKTTLLGLILGLHPVESGTLRVGGHDPWTAGPEVRALIGYAPEHHTLPPDLRAEEFVRHVALLHGLPPAEAITRSSDALWLVGLGEERFRPLGTMSTGQRQRVKLAQAVVHDPRLIMLDEPTDGLDPVQRDAMLQLIAQIASDFEINVILSSHLLDEVEQICDGVVILGDGRVLASGPLDELRGSGEAGITAEFDGTAEQLHRLAGILQHQGWDVVMEGRQFRVRGEGTAVFDAVRDACVDSGVGIVRFAPSRLSLEDVFLERLG
ncbi:MAG: ABC transporter ATP-binding protein [Acidimicrobiales bacterium]